MSYLDHVFGLEGSTAVITGGAGVLAGHMAEALLRAGARVSLWGVHESTLREAAARIAPGAAERRQLDCVVTDTGNPESVLAALRATEASFGGIDVLINAVGGNRGKSPFVDLDIAMFEDVLRLNLLAGLVVPTKVVCKRWIERGSHGSVINLASMGSYVPLSGVWAYNAARRACST
jgi:NAD(P)-dependent dehydrogenase (short-subunit alcohol dehydrogenase family)